MRELIEQWAVSYHLTDESKGKKVTGMELLDFCLNCVLDLDGYCISE